MYGRNIIRRFLSHFDGRFLFLTGDQSPPFQIPDMGMLYLIDWLLILVGLIYIFRNKLSSRILVVFWLFISILPAAFTFMTPSANRTFNAVVPFMIFNTIGIIYVLSIFEDLAGKAPFGHLKGIAKRFLEGVVGRKRLIVIATIVVLYAFNFGLFLKRYFIILSRDHADWWSYGWKQVVEYIKPLEKKYENIFVYDVGMPYVYFLLYQKYPPSIYQKEAVRTYVADEFGYEHVVGFGRYYFPEIDRWQMDKGNKQEKSLYIVPAKESDDDCYNKMFYYPNGKPFVKLFSYE